MLFVGLLTVFLATECLCAVRIQEPPINRDILGSNGPYRDFVQSDCSQPLETGWPCSDLQFAYHWNDALKGCEQAIYHGCNPTRNNFRTLTACKKQAEPICTKTSGTGKSRKY